MRGQRSVISFQRADRQGPNAESKLGAEIMNEKAKKQTLRMIPYGLYVVTARDGDGANGATVSWLSQAAFDPPRIVVGLRNETGIHERVQATGQFAVNVLGTGQKDLASAFFRRVELEGNTIGGARFHEGVTGAPILDDVPAYLECRVVEMLDAGDHTVVLADIVEAGVQNDLGILDLAQTSWHYGG
jgi:flavin reductase (DIM6/NTAB) family NADH-FMN oxidoreductase RutF